MKEHIAQGPVDVNVRDQFEAWISAPPFEHSIERCPTDGTHAWPGSYRVLSVDLAWQAWKAACEFALKDAAKKRLAAQGITCY